MTNETDEQFVERISREVYPGFDGWRTVSMMDHSLDRLFDLARRGAEAADRIEQLEAALREIGNPPNHFTINDAMAVARAALEVK